MNTGALGSLLWFLIIGALFYFMMRMGGCGGHGHHGHSQHGGHSHDESNTGKTKDPVCGMEVKVPDAALSREYMGQTFYFCSPECMEKFDKDPKAYVSADSRHRGCC